MTPTALERTVLAAVSGATSLSSAWPSEAVWPLATGGTDSLAVVALFAGVFVSIGLALLIAVRAFWGFQRTRSRRLLALSAGLLLIVAVPKLTNLGLATVTSIDTQTISVLTAGCRVLGLGVILASIYARE